jgi:hypothetical protein
MRNSGESLRGLAPRLQPRTGGSPNQERNNEPLHRCSTPFASLSGDGRLAHPQD